jgi:hypothetical protein
MTTLETFMTTYNLFNGINTHYLDSFVRERERATHSGLPLYKPDYIPTYTTIQPPYFSFGGCAAFRIPNTKATQTTSFAAGAHDPFHIHKPPYFTTGGRATFR